MLIVAAIVALLLMFGKNWLIGSEFTPLVFAPLAYPVITADENWRGVGALLLMLDFGALLLAWTALWRYMERATKALERLDPGQ